MAKDATQAGDQATTELLAANAREQFSGLLRGAALPTIVVGTLGIGLGLLFSQRAGISAGIGLILVVSFFSLSLLVMRQTAHFAPTVVMGVVLVSYTGKLIALTVALLLLRDLSWLSNRALGLSTILCTLVWLGFELRAFKGLRILVAGSPLPEGRP